MTLPFGLFAGTNTIDPLDPATIEPADAPPGLEQFILDNAGDVATPADGFDQAFFESVAIVDALDTALGALAGDLLSAFTEADTIDAAPVGDTAAGFAGSLAPSSTAVDDLGTLLGSAAPPAPSGGGGTGGAALPISTATGPVLPCTATLGFSLPHVGGRPETGQVFFTNGTSATVHITKLTLVQESGGPFTASTQCTASAIAPGASCAVALILTTDAPAGTTAQLQIETDGPHGTVVLCGTVGAATSGIGGGGGPSGGGPIKSDQG